MGQIDDARALRHLAAGNGQVFAAEGVWLQYLPQAVVHIAVLGRAHGARGAAVKAVDGVEGRGRAQIAGHGGAYRRLAGSRAAVHGDAGGLVYVKQVLVLTRGCPAWGRRGRKRPPACRPRPTIQAGRRRAPRRASARPARSGARPRGAAQARHQPGGEPQRALAKGCGRAGRPVRGRTVRPSVRALTAQRARPHRPLLSSGRSTPCARARSPGARRDSR